MKVSWLFANKYLTCNDKLVQYPSVLERWYTYIKEEQKKLREYIAFEGEKFTIEWYFDTKGTSDALNYFESLNFYNQVKVIDLFKLMGNNGNIRNKTKFNYEGEKIYAFNLSHIGFYVSSLLVIRLW